MQEQTPLWTLTSVQTATKQHKNESSARVHVIFIFSSALSIGRLCPLWDEDGRFEGLGLGAESAHAGKQTAIDEHRHSNKWMACVCRESRLSQLVVTF